MFIFNCINVLNIKVFKGLYSTYFSNMMKQNEKKYNKFKKYKDVVLHRQFKVAFSNKIF